MSPLVDSQAKACFHSRQPPRPPPRTRVAGPAATSPQGVSDFPLPLCSVGFLSGQPLILLISGSSDKSRSQGVLQPVPIVPWCAGPWEQWCLRKSAFCFLRTDTFIFTSCLDRSCFSGFSGSLVEMPTGTSPRGMRLPNTKAQDKHRRTLCQGAGR